MKIATAQRLVETNASHSSAFQIAQSAKMFSVLADKIYTDKIRAVIREIACNALDIAPNVPFKISTPSYNEPYFSVRDYGTGLTSDQMFNIYTKFFESTKAEDDTQVGGFGLGTKAPFAYTDTFTVTSYQNHKKSVYVAFRSSEGIPQLTLAETTITDEPDGLEVIVPVKPADFQSFETKAAEVLKWFPPKSFISYGFHVEPQAFFFQTPLFGLRRASYNTKKVATMGPVPYEFDWDLPAVIVPFFDIGELDLPPSRESLSLDTQTIQALETRNQEIRQKLPALIKNHYYKSGMTRAERVMFTEFLSDNSLKGLLPKNLAQALPTKIRIPGKVSTYSRARTKFKFDYVSHEFDWTAWLKNISIIVDDIQSSESKVVKRLDNASYTTSKYLVMDFDPTELLMGAPNPITYLSDYPLPQTVRKSTKTELRMYAYDSDLRDFKQSDRLPYYGDLWMPMTPEGPQYKVRSEFIKNDIVWGFTKKAQQQLNLDNYIEVSTFLKQEAQRLATPENVKTIADRLFTAGQPQRLVEALSQLREFLPELHQIIDAFDSRAHSGDIIYLEKLIEDGYGPSIEPASYDLSILKKTLKRNPVIQLVADAGIYVHGHKDQIGKMIK